MKKKILLVEDEQDLSVVFNMVVEDGGYEVNCFTDPLLALKSFEAGDIFRPLNHVGCFLEPDGPGNDSAISGIRIERPR
ncbi:MAG: hypothetical protein M3Y53_05830 [Thermoproteota archaeon]|nr:hypothetical protein [Thermoproteota archaeon]